MIKAFILAALLLNLSACLGGGGGGGTATPSATPSSATPAVQASRTTLPASLQKTWYLTTACGDLKAAKLQLIPANETVNDQAIFSWYDTQHHTQYAKDLKITSTVSYVDSIVYGYEATVTDFDQLAIVGEGTLRISSGDLQLNSVCNLTGIEYATSLTGDFDTMLTRIQSRHSTETTALRTSRKSTFDTDWTAIRLDLAGKGLLGGSVECDERTTLATSYLTSLISDIRSANTKYTLYNPTDNWDNATYTALKAQDKADLPLSGCANDLSTLIDNKYSTI